MKKTLLLTALTATTLAVTACGETPGGGQGGSGGGTGALPACAVHLFDGDNFDAGDDNDIIRGPGDFATLKNLPGATTDWAAEADSLKVGSGATVQIWSQENFQGDSKTYQPGSQDGSVMEFRSMKISC